MPQPNLLVREMVKLAGEGRTFVTATVVHVQGSVPQRPGAKLLVADGVQAGTVGGGALEHRLAELSRALLSDPARTTELVELHLVRDLAMCCGGSVKAFLEKVEPPERLVVFGAGHVGRALAAQGRELGFVVTVVDEREDWATAERFPGAELALRHPGEWARHAATDGRTYACVMTHDHALDQEIVEALLRKPLRYLGLIASRRKSEMFRTRLDAKGFTAEEIARLRSPMGVYVGAVSPEEIAVSIAGELVAVRRNVDVRFTRPEPEKAAG
jgi:xanthine dehydrogenase accessory factor